MLKSSMTYDGPIAIRYPRGEAYDGLAEYRAPIEHGKAENITCRIPLIPEFNTPEDQQRSKQELEVMGITRFDLFTYRTNIKK